MFLAKACSVVRYVKHCHQLLVFKQGDHLTGKVVELKVCDGSGGRQSHRNCPGNRCKAAKVVSCFSSGDVPDFSSY